jgi:hypothetical protein
MGRRVFFCLFRLDNSSSEFDKFNSEEVFFHVFPRTLLE